eukprot:361631-Chlamydomonas_euryale.AAC.3
MPLPHATSPCHCPMSLLRATDPHTMGAPPWRRVLATFPDKNPLRANPFARESLCAQRILCGRIPLRENRFVRKESFAGESLCERIALRAKNPLRANPFARESLCAQRISPAKGFPRTTLGSKTVLTDG